MNSVYVIVDLKKESPGVLGCIKSILQQEGYLYAPIIEDDIGRAQEECIHSNTVAAIKINETNNFSFQWRKRSDAQRFIAEGAPNSSCR